MSGLRSLCRCGHVRGSHSHDADGVSVLDGTCRKCTCSGWFPAYPTLDELPPGVMVLRDVSSGLSIVECSHDEMQRGPVGCRFCKGDAHTTDGYTLLVKRLVFAPPAGQLTLA